jgi:BirA family biotin operon repressor/biotin-[acetyl-CoA-carboxylase] ligase
VTPATPTIVRLGRVASTQAVAFALAEEGAPDGTAVVADTQTGGRGRRGRTWVDEPGASLLVSVLLRPRLPADRLPLLSLTAAVAVAEALERVAGLAPRLKWPNDVLVGGRKIAGILLESCLDGHPAAATIILGVGINVGQTAFPPDLVGRATSVRLERGAALDRETLLSGLLDALDRWRACLETAGFEPVRARWRALADTLGRRVEVDGVAGTAVDVDATGALVVRDGGHERRVVAGELAPER